MGSIVFERSADNSVLKVKLSGRWLINDPISKDYQTEIQQLAGCTSVSIDASEVGEWDSSLVATLFKIVRSVQSEPRKVQLSNIPPGAQKLLDLAIAVPERKGARRHELRESLLAQIGQFTVAFRDDGIKALSFVGELTLAFIRMMRGRARVPISDVWRTIEECGPRALPIVTLISTLVGLILAFIGAQQLEQFGAEIYVANLVGIAMTREMGAVMAGVIMAGRTGAAFAAQLGSMEVNEEIDALKTFGFSPMEFLVLPRVLALILMMPLLCLYSDLMGILGGALVSVTVLDFSLLQYLNQTKGAVLLSDIWIGVVKSCVFGVLIAVMGCMKGITCGRSASAVGQAVTGAVVSGIVAVVVADAIFSVLCAVIGI